MMTVQLKKAITVSEFQTFVERDENREGRFELIDGEIVDVPSNPLVSVIAMRIVGFIFMFLQQRKVDGHVSGEGGGFIIDGQVFAPDVAYVRDLPTDKGFEHQPPLLAVEVISDPGNNAEQTDLRRKLAHYMRAGTLVWVVDYVARQVEVHQPGERVVLIGETGKLTAEGILPGFELAVSDIFPQAKQQTDKAE
ncbi:MAG: Uma2 family endonuclease [Chloroflexota bacterium]